MTCLTGLAVGLRARVRAFTTISLYVATFITATLLSLLPTSPLQAAPPPEHAGSGLVNREALISAFQNSDHPKGVWVAEKIAQGQGYWADQEGTLEIFIEDFENGSHRLVQTLVTPEGKRIELLPSSHSPAFSTGDTIAVSGIQLDPEEGQHLSYLAYDSATGGAVTATASVTQTTGNQQTLVLLVNFQDDNSQPFTPQQAADVIFNSSSSFMYENSFGLTSLSGDAYGWFTLPTSISGCNSELLMDLANQAALANGINPSSYQRVVYAHPRRTGCGWSGLASLGGSPSRVLLNGTLDEHNATHEIGHTLGLKHAHAMECGSVPWANSCQNLEYGDSLDNMGARMAHYNGFHKEQLGWLPPGALDTVDSSGAYQLEPYAALPGSHPKVLKVFRNNDPATGNPRWLYIEYRQAVGFDTVIIDEFGYDQNNILNGVIIRSGTDNDTNSSNLLDMTPGSDTVWDFFDAALEVGQSFVDPVSGITISTLSANTSGAQVDIQMTSTPVCSTATPTLGLTPLSSSVGAPGETLQYQLSVTNRDSNDCAAATFNLSATVPNGWSKSLTPTNVTLNPGATGTATLTATSSSTATDGAYVIQGGATQTSSGLSATTTSTYTVDAPEPQNNSAPVAVNDSASTFEKTAVTIPVLNNDSDPEGDALTLVSATQPNKGSVSINSNGTLSYNPPRKFTGTATFSYSISDGNKQSSAQVTVLVEASSGGSNSNGGGGKGGGKGSRK